MIKFFELKAGPCANSIRYDSVFSETDDGYSPAWEPDFAKVDLEKSGGNDYAVIDSKRLEVPLMRRGTQWKDCVPRIFGSGTTYLIISQRIADALIRNRMKGFVLYLTDIKINLYSCKKSQSASVNIT